MDTYQWIMTPSPHKYSTIFHMWYHICRNIFIDFKTDLYIAVQSVNLAVQSVKTTLLPLSLAQVTPLSLFETPPRGWLGEISARGGGGHVARSRLYPRYK